MNKIILFDEETHYKVEPSKGVIPANSYIDFQIVFSPMHAEPYYEFADFIIEEIPIHAMKDSPSHLKEFVNWLLAT